MKNFTYILFILALFIKAPNTFAQVSIMHSDPKSILDIEATDQASPSNIDGLLVPRVDVFPAVNPTADQNGMLVFLNIRTDKYKKGHHYWDHARGDWVYFGSEWLDGYNDKLDNLSYLKQALSENEQDVVILDNGRLGMGTDDPQESLEIRLPGDNDIQVSSAVPPNAPNIIFYSTGGSFASPDFLDFNDPINQIAGNVWDGTQKSDVIANFGVVADGTHSSGDLPTRFDFSVTAPGDTNAVSSNNEMTIKATGRLGIGTITPGANLHLKQGRSSANSAPIKLTAGTSSTSPEAGTLEYDGTDLYFTPNTTRKTILKGLKTTATLDFPLIVNGITDELTLAVPGATLGSSCDCSPVGAIELDLSWSCYVSAPNTVTVRLSKIAALASPIDPASRNWKITVIE